MMTTKVQALNTGAPDETKRALGDIADDLATLKALVATLTAKLDADTGVADTNYAATVAFAPTVTRT
jgi:hypothetical protein